MAVCPFADQSRRYDGRHPGSYASGFGYRGLLHTTETTGLPSYSRGAVAPHFTVDPKTGRIWQHYDTGRPSRALKHPAGTIDTNNARTIQIEIIAYSDAAIAARTKGALRVDQITAAQRAPIAKLMRWIEATHHIASTSGLTFKAYPGSAGTSNGVRLSPARWRAFGGWCGHEHAPANVHGDPSDIAITKLLEQVAPKPKPAPGGDDDMPTLANTGWNDTQGPALRPGAWVTAPMTDKGPSILAGPTTFGGDIVAYLTGVEPGSTVQMCAYLVQQDKDGRWVDAGVSYGIAEAIATAGATFVRYPVTGHAGAGQRLRFKINAGGRITRTAAHLTTWKG